MKDPANILHGKILIVDELEANVDLLDQILRGAGYDAVSSTTNPAEACELHRTHRYDLILLSLHMPDMDGFQVLEGLQKIEPHGYLPVLVITAEQDYKLRALKAGAKDFISKPFELADVLARVHNMLEVRLLYSELVEANKVLASLALHDALTGLPNRRLLMDRFSSAIAHAHRSRGLMAVIYLDLDGFKQVNDTLGHDAGDALLKMVAERMSASVRQEDTVARMGGDEFVILLWELSHAEGADKPASKVMHAVSQPYDIQGHSVNITISAGIGIYPTHGKEAKSLLKCADLALHEAKRKGKNGYCIADA
ncbi:MAG: diguanylate cyclase [Gallionella sp.]|nr:diguanylate cyclase [Gallionella sp.]